MGRHCYFPPSSVSAACSISDTMGSTLGNAQEMSLFSFALYRRRACFGEQLCHSFRYGLRRPNTHLRATVVPVSHPHGCVNHCFPYVSAGRVHFTKSRFGRGCPSSTLFYFDHCVHVKNTLASLLLARVCTAYIPVCILCLDLGVL